ncbi:hypothetical protein CHS0354_035615 [Potamilus streckersoni]|uniref:Double-strand-break repair protein rad21 homolog n=1 Tax=Potamilus streckersoni TaxID=2493646 RepID=A0AAE0VHU1_9BIVA|nr:hypothetical protein CHS0354_035615 [Potamilus streckersoni]
MFYAHFVLSKKGPLARIWLAAHWDKKLTKAHVFETNIDSSVEAIMKPKVKLALRTSGHLLLGVVRIYSRKAKYLLADCNEAFVKIKMAFRPGVVDLPEENREAAVAAITLQENFHDFDTALEDLNDIDVQAQFAVCQSRPEEITMKEDLTSVAFIGDDGFGESEDDFGGPFDEDVIYIYGDCDEKITFDDIIAFAYDVIKNCDKNSFSQNMLPLDSSGQYDSNADFSEELICTRTKLSQDLQCSCTKLDQESACIKSTQPQIYKLDSGLCMENDEDSNLSSDDWYESDEGVCDLEHTSSCGDPVDSGCGSNRGDVGFDERELLRDAQFQESLYKSPHPDMSSVHQNVSDGGKDSTMLAESSREANMDVDLEPPIMDDTFGGPVGLMGETFMEDNDLFQDEPVAASAGSHADRAEGTSGNQVEVPKLPHQSVGEADSVLPPQPAAGASGEQTTLISNEEEAFALEPLDTTNIPGIEKKGKRKRKLVVDEQKGIQSETMKLQLSDTSDIVTTLDLAPPTKKLMLWKETGGVEKLFVLAGKNIISKVASKLFNRNLITKTMTDAEEEDERFLELEAPEVTREEERTTRIVERTQTRDEISTIFEEPSTLEISTRSTRSRRSEAPTLRPAPEPVEKRTEQSAAEDMFGDTTLQDVPLVDLPPEPSLVTQQYDDPPSIAPFSVPPHSVGPPSIAPLSVAPVFNEEVEGEGEEQMPEDAEQEEKRWTKRTQLMQHQLESAFHHRDVLSFKEMSRQLNRKQVTSKFYTLLVLKKHQAVDVEQTESFGDILIRRGPQFGLVS